TSPRDRRLGKPSTAMFRNQKNTTAPPMPSTRPASPITMSLLPNQPGYQAKARKTANTRYAVTTRPPAPTTSSYGCAGEPPPAGVDPTSGAGPTRAAGPAHGTGAGTPEAGRAAPRPT